jgi:NitT/TauT family transport system substrate-binding protein
MIKRGIDRLSETRALGWVAIVLAMAWVAPRRVGAQPAPAAKTHVSLWLDWVPEPEFGGFYQAAQTGAYAAHGLDVEIKTAGPGAPTWQLVDTGKCDYATTAADQVLIARARGADVVALFAVYQTFPQGIMVHKARGFKSIADVFANSGTLAAEDDTWLRFLRAKYPNPKVITTSYSGGVAAFLAKPDYSQQCFVTSEPLQAARQGADPQTFLIADAGYNPYTTVVITRGQTVRSNPGQVRSMIDACRQGWRGYLDDPNAANAAMGKLNSQMDSATFTAAAAAQKPLIETAETGRDRLGMMSSQRWRDLGAQLVQLKVIDRAAGPEECFVQP